MVEIFWLGFDCVHYGDDIDTCDFKFCVNECEKMAKQLYEFGLN